MKCDGGGGEHDSQLGPNMVELGPEIPPLIFSVQKVFHIKKKKKHCRFWGNTALESKHGKWAHDPGTGSLRVRVPQKKWPSGKAPNVHRSLGGKNGQIKPGSFIKKEKK